MTRIVTVQLVATAGIELCIEDGDDPVQIAIDMYNRDDACVSFGNITGSVVEDNG